MAALTLAGTVAQAQWAPGEGRVQFAVLSYQDWQPGFERISVTKPAIAIEVGLTERWQLEAGWLVDTISGASPAYHNVVQSAQQIEDTRRAGDARLTWWGDRTRVTAGFVRSREIDYSSDAVSLTAEFDGADRNTTLAIGASYTSDEIRPVNRPGFVGLKRVQEYLVGITRVITPTDIVQVNLTQFEGHGHFDDPYKLLDNRPDRRRQTTLLARWNHHVPSLGASVQTLARV
ncbi:MAG: DUF3570 domain-containing protein, partial [Rubrivivax sp.]|nr:DUF3570 domain-containing protein [Rubrivivax sp.]